MTTGTEEKKVFIRGISGIGAGLFGVTIFKINIQCGKCECWFRQRLPMVYRPTVKCPHCKTINIAPLEVA